MPTSFIPNSEDSPIKYSPEQAQTEQSMDLPVSAPESMVDSVPETPMPLDSMEGHPTENEHFLEETQEAPRVHTRTATLQHQQMNPVPIPSTKDQFTLQIEKIMEENLGDVFLALTPVQKQQFKIKGEETANKIRQILNTTKVRLGKVIRLIFEWLKLLPGINRFFLEQEAKIKAEKIIALSEHKKHIP